MSTKEAWEEVIARLSLDNAPKFAIILSSK